MRRLGGLTVGLTLTLLLGVPTVSVGSFPASAAEPQKLTIQAGEVWDAASPVFKTSESRIQFATIQEEHRDALGAYKRILRVTEAKVIGGTSATFDTVTEFERASGVRTVFGFERASRSTPWMLRSFKLVLPMPRADEGGAVAAGPAKK